MLRVGLWLSVLTSILWLTCTQGAMAGPPFSTDDPEPTEYRHWEVYLGADYEHAVDGATASVPFAEFNYGLMPNVQFSITFPFEAGWSATRTASYRYGSTEIGAKLRFLQETRALPQVAFYPSVRVASGAQRTGTETFLPLWLQKSWGRWTAYGGAGRWLDSSDHRQNQTFSGLALLRAMSSATTFGVELFHASAAPRSARASTAFNVGVLIVHDAHHGIVASAGRSLDGSTPFS
ncbi:MAG: hypothetical protein JO060_08890, partial [Candidatus Eremiobacteraeota bacterium]|nr:hypothetical protein [Candidatus Eremiobacteraeota bacterium]